MVDFGTNESFIENYKRLKSSRKMSEYYGCSKTSILNHAKKIGYSTTGNKEIKVTGYPVEEVYQKYLELGTTKKVGEYYNCSATAVGNYLKNNGYSLNNLYKLTNATKEEFIADYDNLKSAEKMAQKYSCSSTAILQYAAKIGYDPNSNKQYKLTEENKQFIIDNYENYSSTDLANKYQVSRGMITKLWYDNNLSGKEVKNVKTTEIDLTGQVVGYWTVIRKTANRTSAGNIMWLCRCKCGIEREVSSLSLRSKTSLSCGAHSNISRGNEKIKQILQNANIPFEIEKKFSSCRDKKELPFDFYVNNQYLIEYDGIQHFQPTIFDYEYTHGHDLIKSQWCKDNHMPLIRIPYTAYDTLTIKDLQLETSKYVE